MRSSGPFGEDSVEPDSGAARRAVEELIEAWKEGDEAVRQVWTRYQSASPQVLSALVKADVRRRFARGDRPAVREYLERYPVLEAESDRVVSLVYEEFCLREENGEAPDPDAFCLQYASWGDSLASQLKYHRLLSQVAGAPRSNPIFPALGDRFLQFRLREVLGRGGSALVYLAEDEQLGSRPSALKISADRGEEPSIMGRLDHRRIVPVHSVVRDPKSQLRGLCMPYRPGRPLNQVLERMAAIAPSRRDAASLWRAVAPDGQGDTRPTADGWAGYPMGGSYSDAVAWIGAALADGLAHAHSQGILHRDIKPANILMTTNEGPQLLDFNLAHASHGRPEDAEEAHCGGTLPYMAPEQLDAFLDGTRWDSVGPAADLYALGLVLLELLTGRRPEAPEGDISLPRVIQELKDWRCQPPGSIRAINRTASPGLEAIIHKCLAPNPSARYPDAAALADDLRRFLQRQPPRFAPNPSVRERTRHWASRNRVAMAGTALAALLACSFGLRYEPPSHRRASLRLQAKELASQATYDPREHRRLVEGAGRSGYQITEQDVPEWIKVAQYLMDRAGAAPAGPRSPDVAADLSLAETYIHEAARVSPDSHLVHHARGVLAVRRNQPQDAWQHYNAALAAPSIKRAQPGDVAAIRLQKAGVALQLGLVEDSLAEIHLAEKVTSPSDFPSLDRLAHNLFLIPWTRTKAYVLMADRLRSQFKTDLQSANAWLLILNPWSPAVADLRESTVSHLGQIREFERLAYESTCQALQKDVKNKAQLIPVQRMQESLRDRLNLPPGSSPRIDD